MNPENDQNDPDLESYFSSDPKDDIEQAQMMVSKRLEELRAVTVKTSSGREFLVKNARLHADFWQEANYHYFKDTYPFSLNSDQIGFDFDSIEATPYTSDKLVWLSSVDRFLNTIGDEEWECFISDAAASADAVELDESLTEKLKDDAFVDFTKEKWTKQDAVEALATKTDYGLLGAFAGTRLTPDTIQMLVNSSSVPVDYEDGSAYISMDDVMSDLGTSLEELLELETLRPQWLNLKKALLEALEPDFEQALSKQSKSVHARYAALDPDLQLRVLMALVPDDSRQTPGAVTFLTKVEEASSAWLLAVNRNSRENWGAFNRRREAELEAVWSLAHELVHSEILDRFKHRAPDPDHPRLNLESARGLVASLLEEEVDDDPLDDDLKAEVDAPLEAFHGKPVLQTETFSVWVTKDPSWVDYRSNFSVSDKFLFAVSVEAKGSVVWTLAVFSGGVYKLIDTEGYSFPNSALKLQTGIREVCRAVVSTLETMKLPDKDLLPILTTFGTPEDYDRAVAEDRVGDELHAYDCDFAVKAAYRGELEEARRFVSKQTSGKGTPVDSLLPTGYVYERPNLAGLAIAFGEDQEYGVGRVLGGGAASTLYEINEVDVDDAVAALSSDSLEHVRRFLEGSTITRRSGPVRATRQELSTVSDNELSDMIAGADVGGEILDEVFVGVRDVLATVYLWAVDLLVEEDFMQDLMANLQQAVGKITTTESGAVRIEVPWSDMDEFLDEFRAKNFYRLTATFDDVVRQGLRGKAELPSANVRTLLNDEGEPVSESVLEAFNKDFVDNLKKVRPPRMASDEQQEKLPL